MTKGLGSDIIEIARMRTSIERHGLHFLNRLFSQKEQDYCYKFQDPAPHFTGKFAAKEAVAKALGTGFGANLSWRDLEILNNHSGKPIVLFNEATLQRFQNPQLLISVTHCATYAVAIAIWEN
ncbi:MAG TPA: holo-ACP synthase [Chlamydiales bacterium]|nr:holo-ACP synthase [Chlamydiales bacterium]